MLLSAVFSPVLVLIGNLFIRIGIVSAVSMKFGIFCGGHNHPALAETGVVILTLTNKFLKRRLKTKGQ